VKLCRKELSNLNNIFELMLQTKYMKLLAATDNNKLEIEEKMEVTFAERRALVLSGKYLTSAIINTYPQLKAYRGEMVGVGL
jgi:hypothetical protein